MKAHRFFITFLLGFLIYSCKSEVKNESATELELKIDEYISAHVKNNRFNGTILISEQDSVIFKKSYGFANREKQELINDSTRFLIGSITKPFVVACILKLEEKNKLALSDKLSKYFPEFPNADDVTLEMLLTHTSGITDYHDFEDWKDLSKTEIDPIDVISRVKERPYRFAPGTNFRYSNTGYIFLGLIIEQISHLSFEQYLEQNILTPLKLNQTGVINNNFTPKSFATGYTTTPSQTSKAEYINYNQPFTSGNMYSSAIDLQKFCLNVMDSSLFSAVKTKEIFENNNGYYGYGWGIRDFDGIRAYGHYGGMNGYWGSLTFIPDSKTVICFLTNDDNTPKYTITKDLVSILTQKPYSLPKPLEYIELDADSLSIFDGNYLVKPGDTFHVYHENERIFLKETGQISYELFPTKSGVFAFAMQENVIRFHENENREIDKLFLEGLVNLEVKKVN